MMQITHIIIHMLINHIITTIIMHYALCDEGEVSSSRGVVTSKRNSDVYSDAEPWKAAGAKTTVETGHNDPTRSDKRIGD